MSFNKALVIYRKELLELLRDRRTLFTTIVLPVIMYPLLFMGFSAIMGRQKQVLEQRGATVAFADSTTLNTAASREMSQQIQKSIAGIEYFTLVPYSATTNQLYSEKEIQAVVTLSDSLSQSGLPTYKILIRYDASGEREQLIHSKIKTTLQEQEKEEIGRRLQSLKVAPELIKPFRVESWDTSTAQKKMGTMLGMFLPYIMILTLVAGAATIAADLVAGEKERKTLETLLVSSATRGEIVLGKYLTIITMAMVNVAINLVSLSFSLRFLLSQSGLQTQGLQMPVSAFGILLLAMVPLATLFSALLLSISTFSRNMKEARTYEQPILMVSMMMGMISFIPSVEINNLLALVPVVNIALLFKAVMIGEYQLLHLLLTIGSTLLLDIAAIWTTVRLFNTEAVLFRKEDDSDLKITRTNKRSFFNPFYGLVYFALGVVALFYLGGKWQAADLYRGLAQTQIIIILLPVLLVLRLMKQAPRPILRLRAPRLKEIALVPFIAVSAAVLVALLAQLINHWFPFPKEYINSLMKLFDQDVTLWQSLLVVAVLPGICEEIMFRGWLIRFFEGKQARYAVIVSALLFAIFHLDPFRLLPTFLLGLLLGWLTVRSGSIVNSMLSHAVNNALALLVVTFATQPWLKPFLQNSESFKWWVGLIALPVLILALWAFHRVTANKEVA